MRMSVSTEEVSGGPGPVSGGGGGGSTSTLITTTTGSSSGSGSIRSSSLTPSTGSGMSTMTPTTTAVDPQQPDVVKTAYRRKLKGKKKFFVLRRETESGPARLEYHANEKKYKLGNAPKKSIVLKACFNISRTDSKCKWAVALHTHNDCVRIAMNSEEEMTEWLRLMNSLIGDEDESENMITSSNSTTAMSPTSMNNLMGGVRSHYEHVWLVTALNKGLGSKENILGPYRLCLTSKELTLLKVGDHEEKNAVLKFPLNVIRNVSHDATFGCFFHIEFGRLAPTGPGQLSLKTEDNNIAQNMHLLILKAWQNYSKEDLIPRDGTRRGRTYTWNSFSDSIRPGPGSYHQSTPPVMTRINSIDSSMRIRTESMCSSEFRSGGHGMSPPMPIHTPPPSISFNSPMCSTTDSASSSYSVDFENNNGQQNRRLSSGQLDSSYSKSQDSRDESYVPWNPTGEEPPNLSLPLSPFDTADYVETTIGHQRSETQSTTTTTGSAAATPSSYVEMASPLSPFDNYMSMSPGLGISGVSTKSAGKASSSHSRNSSLIEEHDGYVPMHPGAHHSQSGGSGAGSTAGSTAGLDDSYLDMDFTRKLNLSNDDVRRMSPTSSESLQSGTPSSDYPLEKVSSYLLPSDDLDDSSGPRPLRAYSVGSRSDTSATGKGRFGKIRLEAVQETFRIRALSVGAKNPRAAKPPGSANLFSVLPTTNSGISGNVVHSNYMPSTSVYASTPLSSSWSGSTGRWPPLKFFSQNQTSPSSASHSHQNSNSDTVDSDLMELDFTHNKKGRKRSLPGSGGIGTFSTSSIGSNQSSGSKISPCQKGIAETPETPSAKSAFSSPPYGNYMMAGSTSSGNLKYASSAPISIQKTGGAKNAGGGFANSSESGISILTRMTGLDLKQIKQLDDGAYLDMNFGPSNADESIKSNRTGLKGGNGKRNNLPIIPRSVSLNGPSIPKSPVPVVVVKASENVVPATFNLDKTGSCLISECSASTNCDKSNMIPCSMSVANVPPTSTSSTTSPSLSRIEESPEKQDPTTTARTNSPQSPSPAEAAIPPGLLAVTYASIDHLSSPSQKRENDPDSPGEKGLRNPSPADSVMYSQIDFIKCGKIVKNTN